MLKTDFTVDKVVVYLFCIYIVAMTGLYFHMDSRIKVLQTIQANTLDMFKRYSERDQKQQGDIDTLSTRLDGLKTKLDNIDDSLDDKLTRITNLILNNHGGTSSKK